MNIERAIEVFVHGFAFGRSYTHHYIPERISPGFWVLADAPRRNGEYRNEEYVACGVAPAMVLETALQHTRGRYKISVIRSAVEPADEIRAAYERRFQAHLEAVRLSAMSSGCDYRRVSTAVSYLSTLGGFLVERAG